MLEGPEERVEPCRINGIQVFDPKSMIMAKEGVVEVEEVVEVEAAVEVVVVGDDMVMLLF